LVTSYRTANIEIQKEIAISNSPIMTEFSENLLGLALISTHGYQNFLKQKMDSILEWNMAVSMFGFNLF